MPTTPHCDGRVSVAARRHLPITCADAYHTRTLHPRASLNANSIFRLPIITVPICAFCEETRAPRRRQRPTVETPRAPEYILPPLAAMHMLPNANSIFGLPENTLTSLCPLRCVHEDMRVPCLSCFLVFPHRVATANLTPLVSSPAPQCARHCKVQSAHGGVCFIGGAYLRCGQRLYDGAKPISARG